MENSQISKLSSQEAYNNKKLFSNKIHSRFIQVVEEFSTSFNKFEISNGEDKKLFINAVNHYYYNLSVVIFDLQQIVIQSDDDDHGIPDLRNVIGDLNKIVFLIPETLNLETEKLKIQLKDIVTNVGFPIMKLMKIVKSDNLLVRKQKVLDCQLELAVSTGALNLFIQHGYKNITELIELIHDEMKKLKNNLICIKTAHEHLEQDFSHFTRCSAQYLNNNLDYLRKLNNTESFPNDVSNIFINVMAIGVEFISDFLEAVRYDNPMNNLLDIIENCERKIDEGGVMLQEALQAAKTNNIGKKDDNRVKQLVLHLLIYGINAMNTLNQNIEDAIMKK